MRKLMKGRRNNRKGKCRITVIILCICFSLFILGNIYAKETSFSDCNSVFNNIKKTLYHEINHKSGVVIVEDGSWGNCDYYITSDGICSISCVKQGGGSLNYIGSHNSSFTKVGISYGITNIGDSVFDGYSGLKEVSIYKSVKTIGKKAFANCSSLTDLSIPCSINLANSSSFENVSKLKSLTLTKGDGDMPNYLKKDLNSLPWYNSRKTLTSVTIGDGVETIGNYGLYGLTGIIELELPDGMYEIGSYAFAQCTCLEKLVIPESVKVIDANAFENDISLVLYVYEGSYAERFAKANNMTYKLIKDEEPTTEQPTTVQPITGETTSPIQPTTSEKQSETDVTVVPTTPTYNEVTTKGTVPKPSYTIGKVNRVKLKNKKKRKMIVSWTRAVGAKKYQIKYAFNKKFKKAKTKTITKTKITIKKVKKKKTYYVKVRGFNGGVFGDWSSTKKIKIKK